MLLSFIVKFVLYLHCEKDKNKHRVWPILKQEDRQVHNRFQPEVTTFILTVNVLICAANDRRSSSAISADAKLVRQAVGGIRDNVSRVKDYSARGLRGRDSRGRGAGDDERREVDSQLKF